MLPYYCLFALYAFRSPLFKCRLFDTNIISAIAQHICRQHSQKSLCERGVEVIWDSFDCCDRDNFHCIPMGSSAGPCHGAIRYFISVLIIRLIEARRDGKNLILIGFLRTSRFEHKLLCCSHESSKGSKGDSERHALHCV